MTLPPSPPERSPRISRCWTLCGTEGAVDVEVLASDDQRLGDVLPLVQRTLGVPAPALWAGSLRLGAEVPLVSAALRHGAVLGLDGPLGPAAPLPTPLDLRVAGGPGAGRCLPLGRGLHLVGREHGCAVRLPDPDISRRHLEVRVGDGEVEVRDLGSTNGSWLGDIRLDSAFRPWRPGTRLRLGATTLAIDSSPEPSAVVEPAPGGRTQVRPPHRLRVLREEREVPLPPPPADPPRRRLAWVAVLLPAVGGVLLAWLLRTPTFLFFALLSPLVALGSWVSERWSGRRGSRREQAAYREDLAGAHRALAVAVEADVRAAELQHPDPATVVAAVHRRTELIWSRGATPADPLVVRVGAGPGAVRVSRVEGDGRRVREVARHLPVVVDLSATGGLAVIGPRAHVLGVARALLAQLTALHPPDGLRLLLLTRPDRVPDWAWARWLPHLPAEAVHVAPDADGAPPGGETSLRVLLAGLAAGAGASGAGVSVVVVDRRVDGRTAALLRAAREAGVVLLTGADRAGALPVAADATLTLTGETASSAVLAQDRTLDRTVVVDRLESDLARTVARGLADLLPPHAGSTVPASVRLLDLPGWAMRPERQGPPSGRWPDDRAALRTTLGRSADGAVDLDLCRDGPHALVAGTTGSGKSELLQSLIAGLALNHPPERCSFLLVDYKGGAAFSEAARLPHTVGLVTDLDGSTTARALRSLGAELTRREALLAAHGVAHLAALPANVPLARLVIVVDEFATLAEELPEFVPGLVGIAQRGRSLGIHLVLATQRPGGVVSPEIRANCTVRICLRTTDEGDSRDVVGTPAAAHLPVGVPGRAILRTGNAEPRVLQVARVAVPVEDAPAAAEVRRRSWPLGDVLPMPRATGGITDLGLLVDALSGAAALSGAPAPHRPWQPPLPDRLSATDLDGIGTREAGVAVPTRLRIGLVDRPERQSREPLDLDLAAGGGVLAVGGPRSGRTTFLRTVMRAAAAQLSPDEVHLHVVETGGGGLGAEAAALPHTGTAISGGDAFRTVRLLDRLNQEVEARRAAPSGTTAPLVLLLVDGVEATGALLDESDPGRGSDALLRLVRDGAAVGVTCVLAADRALPGGRLAAAARLRLVLPLGDRADYAAAGVPTRAVPAHRPPGRALLGEDAVECQLVLPRAPAPITRNRPDPATERLPVRIADLPPRPVLPIAPAAPRVGTGDRWPLAIGPGGDEGDLQVVDLRRSGGLLVIGPPGSGRTAALETFGRRLAAAGAAVAWLTTTHRTPPDAPGTPLDPADLDAVASWVDRLDGRRGVLLADDLGSPAEHGGLAALPPLGAGTGLAFLAAGSPGQLTSHYQGPVAALRRARTGLLLCATAADAEVLGIRLSRLPLPVRPGSGWLVDAGAARRVQVARTPPADAASPR